MMDVCHLHNTTIWPYCFFRVKSQDQGDILLDQVETLQRYGCIPSETHFGSIVVSEDPPKGSGGGFVESIPYLPPKGPILYFLVGESSTRIPAFSFRGKSFSPLPSGFPFCRHYYKLGRLLLEKGPYLTITCGDTLLEDLTLEPVQDDINEGIWALTCRASLDDCSQVGAFSLAGNRVKECLQKQPIEKLSTYPEVTIDTGIFCFDRESVSYLQGQDHRYPLHFYADLIPALLERGVNTCLLDGRFVHVGTNHSYVEEYVREMKGPSCPLNHNVGPAVEKRVPGWPKRIVQDLLSKMEEAYNRGDSPWTEEYLPWVLSCMSVGPHHNVLQQLAELHQQGMDR